jgi:4-azaleucine resistance transporter AzlC
VAAATPKDVWRAAMFFTATSALIGLSFGVLARTSGISLAMTCAMSLLVFAGGAQFLAIATIASGGSPLAVVLGGVVLNARHLPYGLAVAPLLRGPLWKRALSSQIVLDESTALALAQPTPELGRLAFYACGCSLFVAWNLGTLIGALAGGAIADPSALGLDAAFPASMLALLAPLLRQRDVRAAALAGAAIALAATPFTAPGVPILAAAAGVLVARLMPAGEPA